MVAMPALDGLEHRYVDLGDGVTIHVADAGPADGPAVMPVHGFPENWWEWHELIGPLAAAAILDRLSVAKVKLVAHDWGGPVAFIMMLRHPEKVTGFSA